MLVVVRQTVQWFVQRLRAFHSGALQYPTVSELAGWKCLVWFGFQMWLYIVHEETAYKKILEF